MDASHVLGLTHLYYAVCIILYNSCWLFTVHYCLSCLSQTVVHQKQKDFSMSISSQSYAIFIPSNHTLHIQRKKR